ncbi:MAG: dephospho-CoA kinase [Desulfobulbaceae bacterium]|uniref:Dephospho-CoA kinase n=1 Tax=Candidatus Desulfobia pelagia TaxID=2841692 RepID=A0A8J6TBM2_9BACT|nr:dephospho-CoA kinase [Candidatus Desulfobia pelagia]
MSRKKISVTGITGGIGSGKSRAAAFLCSRYPVCCLSADACVHDLLEPGQAGWEAVQKLDPIYVRDDQTINKPLLRTHLFSDAALRQEINDALHPLVQKQIVAEVERETKKGHLAFLVEVPLLFEARWQSLFHDIIVVYASREKCIQRITYRDNVSSDDAERALASQMPLAEKVELAGHVINNSGIWLDTVLQLIHLGNLLWLQSAKK